MKSVISKALKAVLNIALGWLVIIPINYLVPRQKSVVFLTDYGNFACNVKYLFLHALACQDKELEVYYLTEDRALYEELIGEVPMLYYPQWQSIVKLMRASLVIVNVIGWQKNLKYFFSFRARKVQLWHANGFKSLDSFKPSTPNVFYQVYRKLSGIEPLYDLLVLNSRFQREIRGQDFRYKELFYATQARIDAFTSGITARTLLGSDGECLKKVQSYKAQGFRIIIYAPTFRDTGGDAFTEQVISLTEMSRFAKEYNFLFVLKFHPDYELKLQALDQIVQYDNKKDVYPLLSLADLLVTDYSSIFVDFLFLHKPLVFFPYDLTKYLTQDRQLKLDYESFVPGPRYFNQADLEQGIYEILNGKDDFGQRREDLLRKVYENLEGNYAERIWEHLLSKYFPS